MGSDVAKALNDGGRTTEPTMSRSFMTRRVRWATPRPGSLATPQRAAELYGLSGDDLGDGAARGTWNRYP